LVASGGGGALEKQLDNQLDCWWKAKGGVDERPGSRRWRLATMYGRRRKTDASSFVVIMIVIIGEGQGGRGPRKEREKTTRLSPTNDDCDARLQ
jgi:homoserine acetyltransferase